MRSRLPTLLVLVVLGLITGCARKAPARQQAAAPLTASTAVATALCFDPPVLAGGAATGDLDRDGRDAEAFIGYATAATEAYVIRTNDRQLFNNPAGFGRTGRFGGGSDFGYYDRQAYSERSGVLVR